MIALLQNDYIKVASYIAYKCLEPYIYFFILIAGEWYFNTPVKIPCYRSGMKPLFVSYCSIAVIGIISSRYRVSIFTSGS